MKKILSISIFSFFLSLLILISPKTTFAAGNLYFSPSSGTKYNGQNFTVSVRASGMDSVDGVKAVVIFPTDKLTYVSASSSGSAWGIQAQQTVSGGTVEFDRGNIGNLSGDKLVATITFRPKTNTGTASLSFSADSALTRAGTNVISGKGTANYTLATAPPPPPPPVADTTPPTITNVQVTALSVNTATVTWTTNEASDSTVLYGMKAGTYVLSANKPDMVTSHSVELSKDFLEPGTSYHFLVNSKDAAGNVGKGTDQTFSTIGYEVKVTVQDSNNNPLANLKVSLHSETQEVTTDGNGVADFKNVTVGDHVLTAVINGSEIANQITVKDIGAKQSKDKNGLALFTTNPQSFNVKLAAAAPNNMFNTILLIIIGILVLILFGVVGFWFIKRKKPSA